MKKYRRGWYGDSHGHSLAAKGIKKYNATKQLEKSFYYQRLEAELPLKDLMQDVSAGKTFEEIRAQYPNIDEQSMRKRAIKILDGREGHNTLMTLDELGVDENVRLAVQSSMTRKRMRETLQDRQKSSFLPAEKRMFIERRIGEIQ